MKKLIFIFALLCGSAFGTTRYIAQSAGTFSGGTACNGQTAITAATFNATSLTAGDIAYICGTITGSTGTSLIVPHNGGSSGNNIQILFDTSATLTATYWGTGGAIDLAGLSYVLVDGSPGSNCGWVAQAEVTCNGTITASANTTSTNNQPSYGVELSGSSNIEVRGLNITNMLVQTKNSSTQGNNSTVLIDITNSTTILVHNNYGHDAHAGYQVQWSSGTSGPITIYNNVSANACEGYVAASGGSSPALSSLVIHDNESKDGNNWDSPAVDDYCHEDHFHAWAEAGGNGGTVTGMQVYNNTFHGDLGCNQNGYIYFEADVGENTSPLYFNNLLINTSSNASCPSGLQATPASGYIGLKGGGSGGGCAGTTGVYNNTIVGNITTATNGNNFGIFLENGCAGVDARNNLVDTDNTNIVLNSAGDSFSILNYTDYYNFPTSGGCGAFYNHSCGSIYTIAAWHTATGLDANSINSNPNLSASYAPNLGSPLIQAGVNLTSLSITALNTDECGNSRPLSAAWDIGACQYASGGPPLPPTGLTATVSP